MAFVDCILAVAAREACTLRLQQSNARGLLEQGSDGVDRKSAYIWEDVDEGQA